MTVWSFFGIQGSKYLPWILWPLKWWLALHYLNLITNPTPLQMRLNWSRQWVYPNHQGSKMGTNYVGSQMHPNGWGSWMHPNSWGSQTWPGWGRRCAQALPSRLTLFARGSCDLKWLLQWWSLFKDTLWVIYFILMTKNRTNSSVLNLIPFLNRSESLFTPRASWIWMTKMHVAEGGGKQEDGFVILWWGSYCVNRNITRKWKHKWQCKKMPIFKSNLSADLANKPKDRPNWIRWMPVCARWKALFLQIDRVLFCVACKHMISLPTMCLQTYHMFASLAILFNPLANIS